MQEPSRTIGFLPLPALPPVPPAPPRKCPKWHPKPHLKKVTKIGATVTPTGLQKGPKKHQNLTRRRCNSARKGRPQSDAQKITQSARKSSQNEAKMERASIKKGSCTKKLRPRFLLLFTTLGGHRPSQEGLKNDPKMHGKSMPAFILKKAPKRHQKCSY